MSQWKPCHCTIEHIGTWLTLLSLRSLCTSHLRADGDPSGRSYRADWIPVGAGMAFQSEPSCRHESHVSHSPWFPQPVKIDGPVWGPRYLIRPSAFIVSRTEGRAATRVM